MSFQKIRIKLLAVRFQKCAGFEENSLRVFAKRTSR